MLELTLDEAIKHCKENVQKETQNGNLQCAAEHNQLAIWLSQLEESKSKAAAYDRLMSGGKKTPKEVANFFGFPIAMNKYGAWYTFPTIPIIAETGFWYSQVYPTGRFSHSIPTIDQIDFTGDWENSLTMPDGWEE